ncbi:MAG: glycosyl hydrolase 115 family protein [Verrucomicrobia bacterium]|nr:glycosyl hydrolase 115 family protein [Verrucomicrobiota bacterium]
MLLFRCLIIAALLGSIAEAPAAVRLTPGVPLFVPEGAPASVLLAVEDLRRDLEMVLGAPSPVVTELAVLRGRSAILILGANQAPPRLHDSRVTGRESHGIHVGELEGTPHIVLEGADPRGVIYAIYSFSDEFLDVPPLWYWSGWKPKRRNAIEVPADTVRLFPPAYVRWRAWFNNDTDFLTPWRERSPANDHAVYETVLRLKYNTYEIGSVADLRRDSPPFAVNPDAAGAHARGLVITHHHTSPLGSSLRDWDAFWRRQGREPAPLTVSAHANLAAFWRYHAETAKRAGFEQVWTIVFRGAGDIPFWQTFRDAPAETAARAQIISDMLRAQVAIVKEVTADPAPDMRTTLYNEGSTMFAAGLLRPPAEPTLIWNFVAARRDHFPAEDVRGFKAPPDRLIGYYLNFQFTSSGSHLAAAEGPWKMAANYRIVDATGDRPLAFTVVNAGNIREHLAELSANADMMWRFREFDADEFLRRFCARYFGAAQAAEAAELYRAYYQAYWTQKPSDIPGFARQYLFQDMRYARAVEMLLKDMAAGIHRPNPLDGHPLDRPDTGGGYFRVELRPGDANQVAALLRGTAESGRQFAAIVAQADALMPRIAPEGRVFFDDNLRLRARVMQQLNSLLHESTLAYQAYGNQEARRRHLAAAVGCVESVRAMLDLTQHRTFAGWYDSDRVFGLDALRDKLRQEIASGR